MFADNTTPHFCSRHDTARPASGEKRAVRIALLTPLGQGALAVVGVRGEESLRMVASLFVSRGRTPLEDRPRGSVCVGHWQAPLLAGAASAAVQGEELVVVRGTPADPEGLEIHCHGGSAASEAVLRSLESCGAVRQAWPDWLAEEEPLIAREARVALAHAGGPKAARILCRQLAGHLEREVERVGGLLAAGDRAAFEAGVDRLLRAARVGLRLIRPWRVVVTGAVNAGKSSLVNALAGYARSLVAPEPGTTRDLLETRLVLGGWEIDLIDAAGWRGEGHLGAGAVEREGIERAVNAAAAADLVLAVNPVGAEPTSRLGEVRPLESGIEMLKVVTKSDLAEGARLAEGSSIVTSAHTGQGIEALAEAIIQRLVPEELADPELLEGPVPFTLRQVAQISTLAGLKKSEPPIGFQDS